MPAHIKVANHDAYSISERFTPATNAADLVLRTWGEKEKQFRCTQLLHSSLKGHTTDDTSRTHPKFNGFVDTILLAYNEHHHLCIRPDDVWMAILAQFSIYVNGHAEELRSHFVQHEGKKKLTLHNFRNRYAPDFVGSFGNEMTGLVDKNLSDKGSRKWILPDFSTTSHSDTIVCAIFLMATLKAYLFLLRHRNGCGIPSVTLEGEKYDWEKLLSRLDKLDEFGPEPAAWARFLRPILTRFVQAFDGDSTADFWGTVCRYTIQGSGSRAISGWLTAFCVWDKNGNWQGPPITVPQTQSASLDLNRRLLLDGVHYGRVKIGDIPLGFCEVDIEVNDETGKTPDCMMVSGHCGMAVEGEMGDTIRPLAAWFMFEKEKCDDIIMDERARTRTPNDLAKVQYLDTF